MNSQRMGTIPRGGQMKNYNKLLSSFMELKSIHLEEMTTIPKEWYFVDGDRDEIMSWDEGEAEKIWIKMDKRIEKHNASGLNYELCPFCYFNNYNHEITVSKRHNPSCMKCGYGQRHGICTEIYQSEEEQSQFQRILRTLKLEGFNVYKTLSNGYYKSLAEKLEDEFLSRKKSAAKD